MDKYKQTRKLANNTDHDEKEPGIEFLPLPTLIHPVRFISTTKIGAHTCLLSCDHLMSTLNNSFLLSVGIQRKFSSRGN